MLLAISGDKDACPSSFGPRSVPQNFKQWLMQSSPSDRPTGYAAPRPGNYLIVGGGPGGLAVAAEFRQRGLPFVLVERSKDYGGVWNPDNPDSPAYPGLATNSSKATTFLDRRMPDSFPDYPTQADAHRYLFEFAKRHGLRANTRFQSKVIAASKDLFGKWEVTLYDASRDKTYQEHFDGIISANGAFQKDARRFSQDLMDQAKTQGLLALHSADCQDFEAFRDKVVLVQGAGNSALELAAALSGIARQVYHSYRSTPYIVPLYIGKTPADEYFAKTPEWILRWIPYSLQMGFFSRLQRKLIGEPKKLGFREPNHRLMERLPVSDRGYVEALRKGSIVLRPNVIGFSDGQANFEGALNPPLPVDAVVFATGYTRQVPYLDRDLVRLEDPDFTMPFHIFHPRETGLAFMTEVIVPKGVWPTFAAQARAIGSYYQARSMGRPSASQFDRMRSYAQNPDFKGKLFQKADRYHVDPSRYDRMLLDFSRWMDSP